MADLLRFDWEDALCLEAALSEDERIIAATARAFARDRLQPRAITGIAAF